MEQTKFTDVAHLYIGAKIYLPAKNVLKMIGIVKAPSGTMALLDADNGHWVILEQDTYKPILRPLTSITNEEALEFGKMILDRDVNHITEIRKNEDDDSVKIGYTNGMEYVEITNYYISASRIFENVAEEVCINNYNKAILWLTNKQFDIFGLIKTREALTLEV